MSRLPALKSVDVIRTLQQAGFVEHRQRGSEYLAQKETQSILSDCEELMRILGSIQKTMKIRNS